MRFNEHINNLKCHKLSLINVSSVKLLCQIGRLSRYPGNSWKALQEKSHLGMPWKFNTLCKSYWNGNVIYHCIGKVKE